MEFMHRESDWFYFLFFIIIIIGKYNFAKSTVKRTKIKKKSNNYQEQDNKIEEKKNSQNYWN
jgi:hypothetical protein